MFQKNVKPCRNKTLNTSSKIILPKCVEEAQTLLFWMHSIIRICAYLQILIGMHFSSLPIHTKSVYLSLETISMIGFPKITPNWNLLQYVPMYIVKRILLVHCLHHILFLEYMNQKVGQKSYFKKSVVRQACTSCINGLGGKVSNKL